MKAFERVCRIAAIAAVAAVLAAGAAKSAAPDAAGTDSLRTIFAEANSLYERGDYAGAIDAYRRLRDAGVDDATLFYNLGNAYYKSGRLGKAVYYYERVLRIAPRYRDARENLALIRLQLQDKQFVGERNRLVRALIWLHTRLTTGEMVALASVSYWLFCLLAIALVFHETAAIRTVYRAVSIVSPGRLFGLSPLQDLLAAMAFVFAVSATTGISAWRKIDAEARPRRAVVMAREIPVFSGPTDDATLQFKIHEGTMVKVREARKNWARVALPGGLSGWVRSSAIENI